MVTYAFETPRLWLQKLTVEEHLEDFHEMWSRPEALIWSTQAPKKTLAESTSWMESQLPSAENPDIDKYAILLKPTGENPQPWVNKNGTPKMIGMTGTNRYSDEGLETGYCVNYEYWGKGYATEAFKGFLEMYWALEERRSVMQLVAKVDPGNVPSQRIVLRVGGVKGGILREWYARPRDEGRKRDIEFWLIDRPGAGAKEMEKWKDEVRRQMKRIEAQKAEEMRMETEGEVKKETKVLN